MTRVISTRNATRFKIAAIAMLRRRNGNQRPHALAQAAPAQMRHAVLGGHHIDVAARGGHGAGQAADDLRVATRARGRQGHDGDAAFGQRGGADVVDLPTDGADVLAAHRAVGLRLVRRIDVREWQTLVIRRPG